ncbi:PRD domain-containing protein [Streptococcus merionis]|uniref:Transcription anti-terminator, BglG family n=1 Tax=Streptococcus merionis TaxID=400065 RepID=A0A239SVD5_9STRE|nr:PRD domain-containing protein [Streptococcus merionis]SNU89407.1 transcription anti-terminator, BglG family [Streptococcus merionis]
MIIKKVLNSSVVLVDDEGIEKIALGKGIGFGKKQGETVLISSIDKLFQSVNTPQAQHLLGLLNEVPSIYFDLAQDIIEQAKQVLNTPLQDSLWIGLTDHIYFAVERFEKGFVFDNKVFWEIKSYYGKEYQIGYYAIKLLNKTFNISLPEAEAANIAFHFINAQQSSDKSDASRIAKLIGDLETLVRYSLNVHFKNDEISYQRFITHIRFFAERFFADKMLQDGNQALFDQICRTMPEGMRQATKIQTYLEEHYNKTITIDELTYLAIHFERLTRKR